MQSISHRPKWNFVLMLCIHLLLPLHSARCMPTHSMESSISIRDMIFIDSWSHPWLLTLLLKSQHTPTWFFLCGVPKVGLQSYILDKLCKLIKINKMDNISAHENYKETSIPVKIFLGTWICWTDSDITTQKCDELKQSLGPTKTIFF